MSNDDFRRELNIAFDDIAGSPSRVLRDRVRSSLRQAPELRGQYWVAAVAAGVIAVLVVAVLLVANLPKAPSPITGGAPGPTATPSPTGSPTPSPSPTSQLPPFACAVHDFVSATTQSTPSVVYISALRTGTHQTYDRITIEFANGVPHDLQVSAPSAGTTFALSPSGQSVTLKGDHGILVTIHGTDLHTSYSGSLDIVTGYTTLAEVRKVQDFEGVVQIGLGVNGSGCYRAFWMTNPDRLEIDIQAPA
jgi:hypothetical protein